METENKNEGKEVKKLSINWDAVRETIIRQKKINAAFEQGLEPDPELTKYFVDLTAVHEYMRNKEQA